MELELLSLKLHQNPWLPLPDEASVQRAARLGVQVDVNRASAAQWQRLPGMNWQWIERLLQLQRQGAHLRDLEELGQQLGAPPALLRLWQPVLVFRAHGDHPPLPPLVDVNGASGHQLCSLPGLDGGQVTLLLRERQRGRFRGLADLQSRLRLPDPVMAALAGQIHCGRGPVPPDLPRRVFKLDPSPASVLDRDVTQPNLFPTGGDNRLVGGHLRLRRDQLQHWQAGVASRQQAARLGESGHQGQLFAAPQDALLPCGIDPFRLLPQPLSFWRWPEPPNQGAAHYFVIDDAPHLPHSLLLYVGETGQAARRWKGSHDCKAYLASYLQALQTVKLTAAVSVRFWCDAPSQRTARRAQETQLIQYWQPPFNREMQGRWRTPFTALAD